MPLEPFNPADLLRQQLDATRKTWTRLLQHGVHDGTQLKLDFFYAAPTHARATQLQRFLEQETDYAIRVTADRDEWTLSGNTQPTALSLVIVEQWVDWMIGAGLMFECVFDGWGAEIP